MTYNETGSDGVLLNGTSFTFIGIIASGGVLLNGNAIDAKSFVEIGRGSILGGGDCVDRLQMRIETGSGGCSVSSIAQVWSVRATDIKQTNIGLTMNNYNILKIQEEINATSKPNKKKIMKSTGVTVASKSIFSYPNTNGWCTFEEKCPNDKKAYLPIITQKNLAGALPPKN